MKKITLLFTLLACSLVTAQHTFSIVAVDPTTGEIGSAGATCLDIDDLAGEEGALVISDIILGIGAINTQAAWSPVNQAAARDRMEAGDSPQQILDWLLANDPAPGGPQSRQYGVVDLIGGAGGTPRSAAFTGTQNFSVANDITGPNYAIQGNILISQEVLDDMETAFLNTTGTLADKLMAAMQGAKRIGADNRCTTNQTSSKSAFLRVANVDDLFTNYGHLTIDLNVSKTNVAEDPIDVLQDTYDFYLNNPAPVCDSTTDLFYTESFEDGLGLWVQNDIDLSHVGNTDFDWTRNSGPTPTNNTGPQEAAFGDFYLYTEASGTNVGNPTKRATLDSPCIDLSIATNFPYVDFYYHIFGNNTGNLAVRVNDGTGWKTVWLVEGNQGDEWNYGSVDLTEYIDQNIQIRFDSTTGIGEQGDIAIDHVTIGEFFIGFDDYETDEVFFYPNPVTDILNWSANDAEELQFELFDVTGKRLLSQTYSIAQRRYSVSLENLPVGMYFAKVTTEDGEVLKQIIKQ